MVSSTPPMARSVHHHSALDPHDVAMGLAVRGVMATTKLTRDLLAPSAGLSVNSLSRRLNGLLPFTWTELVRIADATGTTVLALAESASEIYQRNAA